MAFKLDDYTTEAHPPIVVNGLAAEGVTAQDIAFTIEGTAKNEYGLPVVTKADVIKEGGLFNSKTYPCVLVSNPTQRYYHQMIVMDGDTLRFYLGGVSGADWENEKHWHYRLLDTYEKIFGITYR